MLHRLSLLVTLLSATAGIVAAQNFRLGVDYSELIPPTAVPPAADSSGAVYLLANFGQETATG
ncbi:MAG: hypothetical protein ACLP59_13925 [Bryobacteraceae bacterium]